MDKQAYRGYVLCFNYLNGLRWVEKGGRFIGYIRSIEEGRQIIDSLVNQPDMEHV